MNAIQPLRNRPLSSPRALACLLLFMLLAVQALTITSTSHAGSDETSGRMIDLFTQKGVFMQGESVDLTALVTFNGFPVQQKLVSFEVKNPLNETVVLRSGITNQSGMASISFRIPIEPSSIGEWRAIAVVDIAEQTVSDTVTFLVNIFVIPELFLGTIGGLLASFGAFGIFSIRKRRPL